MRNRSIEEMFLYEADRLPALKALIERVDNMSDSEIDALDLPMKWYKDGLKAIRAMRRFSTIQMKINTVLDNLPQEYVPDPEGTMAEWLNDDHYMRTSSGALLQVPYGRLVWFPDTGGVWYETSFGYDPKMLAARRIRRCRKTEYIAEYKSRLVRNCGDVPYTVVANPVESPTSASAVLGRYGVRFS